MQVPDPNPLAHLWWWFEIHLGITPKAPPSYYDAWSGSFSDIGEVTLLGAVIVGIRHINCHVTGCRKIRTHPVPNTPYRACRKHHPTVPSNGPITAQHLEAAHQEANQ